MVTPASGMSGLWLKLDSHCLITYIPGKYVGGFDCMENCLMNKGLVKKEAAREPT